MDLELILFTALTVPSCVKKYVFKPSIFSISSIFINFPMFLILDPKYLLVHLQVNLIQELQK